MNLILVFLGGAIGASIRYMISCICKEIPFFEVIFFVNILGCLFFGLVVGLSLKNHKSLEKKIKLFLTTGVAGGFTTFSTFSYDCFRLIETHNFLLFLVYAFLSVFISILFFYTGLFLSEFIQSRKTKKSSEGVIN